MKQVDEQAGPSPATEYQVPTPPKSRSPSIHRIQKICGFARSSCFLKTAVQMDAVMAAGDAVADLLTAVATEDPVCEMPDFKMGGKKDDEAAPTDAGDEDDGDDGDEDGDFGEGEEDVSDGETYDNAKGIDKNKKQRGEPEENGEEDEEEPEGQEGGGGDDDDDDDDENEDDDDEEDGEDDDEGVEEEDDDQDHGDDEEDDDEDSLQPPKKRKK
ncbi:hypothetical protein GUJ93_ZPchr0004g38518 [Zizania palustris]|uniref:Uncharacterized protein n=1 Tax=Zizania palustris TaxID=103762 RepID=A0A8J5S2D1_ZIZPA|nr:hypothetical protein GUJ93_ZPchr0004g38518 [Zizania palustris]